MTKPLALRVRRFIVAALCSLLVRGGVCLIMVKFTDLNAPSVLGTVCLDFLAVAMWPVALYVKFIYGDLSINADVILFFVSGLFWALVVDLFLVIRDKYKAL
jgi:hypothetical protein